jgi:hypothetical protein
MDTRMSSRQDVTGEKNWGIRGRGVSDEFFPGRILRDAQVSVAAGSCTLPIRLRNVATEQVRAIVIWDESVREAKISPGVRVAKTASWYGPAGSLAQFSVEDVFIAQLHNRAGLLNDGFQVTHRSAMMSTSFWYHMKITVA